MKGPPAERVLRSLLLVGATLGGFAPLFLRAGSASGWGVPALCAGLVLVLAAAALRAEQRPEELDGDLTRRVGALAPLAVGVVATGALLFPVLGWRYGWLVFAVDVPLIFFWHLPRNRTVSLGLATVAALAAQVLDPASAPALVPVGLAWALVPPLDRLGALRGRIDGRPPAPLGALLLAGGAAFAAGALVLAGVLVGVPEGALVERAGLDESLAPGERAPVGPPAGSALPSSSRIALALLGLVLCLVLLVLARRLLARRGDGGGDAPSAEGMAVGAGAPLDEAAQRAEVARWPEGPRRRLVAGYLDHLARLEARGWERAPGQTPAAFAEAVGARRPAAGSPAAELAHLFGKARWSPEEVSAAEAERAGADARAVEEQEEAGGA